MEQNPRYEEIDHYEHEFWSIIEKSFGINLEGMSASASPFLNGPIEFIARFPTKNANLKNSSYYFDQTQKLIHFTSLPKLFSIISDCSLRMYNLNNSNDPEEYSYAANLLKTIFKTQGFTDEWIEYKIEKEKEFSFITSFTTLENLENETFWNKYGNLKKGVAIEFEIVNKLVNWEYFYLSPVHYNKLDEFDTLLSEWINLQHKNRNILYKIDLDQILSLHKSLSWSTENEIRLLTMYPDLHDKPFRELIYKDTKETSPHCTKIQYFRLPLCDKQGLFINKSYNQKPELFWELMPKLRISDLHFGPNFEIDIDFCRFQSVLRSFIYDKMNCWLLNLPKQRVKL